jgi:hypothetical protein
MKHIAAVLLTLLWPVACQTPRVTAEQFATVKAAVLAHNLFLDFLIRAFATALLLLVELAIVLSHESF